MQRRKITTLRNLLLLKRTFFKGFLQQSVLTLVLDLLTAFNMDALENGV